MKFGISWVLALIISSVCSAQMRVEYDFFVADHGNNQVRQYSYTGQLIATLPSIGSGSLRSVETDAFGDLYVARGTSVWRFAAPTYQPDATPFATGNSAQGIAVDPITGNIWCSFGNTTGNAEIREITTAGTVLQTLMGSPLQHPRSMEFDWSGNTLFVANQNNAGSNPTSVLAIDPITGTMQVHVDLTNYGSGFRPNAISVAPEEDNLIYVTGDFGETQEIIEVSGPTGATTIRTLIDYSIFPDMTSPAGSYADSYGNLYVVGRNKSMGIPGIYGFDRATGIRILPGYFGMEHSSLIDICFLKLDLDVRVTSGDGVTAAGNARVLGGTHNGQLQIDIEAPAFPSAPYGMFWSVIPDDVTNASILRPQNTMTGIPIDLSDPRRHPLEPDTLFQSSIALAYLGGQGFVPADPSLCPGSFPGFFTLTIGQLNTNGRVSIPLSFPSLPCLFPGFRAVMGFSVAVVDNSTGPLGVGLLSNTPALLILEGQ